MPQSDQTGEKIGQIVGVVVNVPRLQGFGGDVDGFHAHVMRGGKVARIIFEHGGSGGVEPILRKDRLEGGAFGFGAKARVFDAVNRIEQAREATRL